MGRIGQKSLLGGDGLFQSGQQSVDGCNQRRYLDRHRVFVQRAEVIGLALANALFQTAQGLDAARQRQPLLGPEALD